MHTLADIFFFLLGIHLTMQLIASFYRIIDLWYRIEDFIKPIARSIISYTIIMLLIWWYFEGSYESAFLWGCLFFLGFHLSIFWIGQAIFRGRRWWQGREG